MKFIGLNLCAILNTTDYKVCLQFNKYARI